MESLILDTNNIVNDQSDRIIVSDSPSIQGIVFYDSNAAIYIKVITMQDENNVVIKEYDILTECIIGAKIIFNKELAENLANEEYS